MNKPQSDLDHLRHSCSHLLAAAVIKLWPKTKRAIGPAIENGFYYDFDFENSITESDLTKINKVMREILPSWKSFERFELTAQNAKKEFPGNEYKHELIDEFSENDKKKVSFYKSGDYQDLCRGGHVENPAKALKHFKLLSIAGAYWRGSEKNKMLTRIYGTCFPTKEELDKYLWQQEEAKKRDHKKIGKEQNLFVISNQVGGGLPLFTPKGTIFRKLVEEYLTKIKQDNGYQFVWTPHIAKKQIYVRSKHWGKYDAMFNPMKLDNEEYIIKPMNCPHHFEIYLSKPRSYKELPLRLAENATVYRYEKSGELNGLLRVRSATIDDTHTFVSSDSEEIAKELDNVIGLIKKIVEDFGFKSYEVRISTRDKNNPQKYIGNPKLWDVAETSLKLAAQEQKIKSYVGEGEAAFYGPKIDFMINDSIGRQWQCSTVQLDFAQPENFELDFTDEKGEKKRPAVIHIAMIGSIERFMGVLIEHYGGAFPLWLSPVQVMLIPIADRHQNSAETIKQQLRSYKIRAEVDLRQESMQAKIRDATLQKIPYLGIIGDEETKLTNPAVSVRKRNGEVIGRLTIEEFKSRLTQEIETKIS